MGSIFYGGEKMTNHQKDMEELLGTANLALAGLIAMVVVTLYSFYFFSNAD